MNTKRSLECPDNSLFGHKNIIAESMGRYNFVKHLVPGKTVLDVGCGRGYGSILLYENGAKKVIGIDNNPQVVTEAKKMSQGKENIDFMFIAGLPWQLSDNSFDVVIALEVIEHVDDDGLFLAEIRRILRSGGFLAISTPNKIITSGGLNKPAFEFHKREYVFQEFDLLIKKYFSEVEIVGQDFTGYNKKLINRLVDAIPSGIKNLFPLGVLNAASVMVRPRLKDSDFTFSKGNISDARNFVAVCRKN